MFRTNCAGAGFPSPPPPHAPRRPAMHANKANRINPLFTSPYYHLIYSSAFFLCPRSRPFFYMTDAHKKTVIKIVSSVAIVTHDFMINHLITLDHLFRVKLLNRFRHSPEMFGIQIFIRGILCYEFRNPFYR